MNPWMILDLVLLALLLRLTLAGASRLWRTLKQSIEERQRRRRHQRLFPIITKVALSFLTPYPEYLGQPDSRTFSERLLSKRSETGGSSHGE